jgi:hypothetical protein
LPAPDFPPDLDRDGHDQGQVEKFRDKRAADQGEAAKEDSETDADLILSTSDKRLHLPDAT